MLPRSLTSFRSPCADIRPIIKKKPSLARDGKPFRGTTLLSARGQPTAYAPSSNPGNGGQPAWAYSELPFHPATPGCVSAWTLIASHRPATLSKGAPSPTFPLHRRSRSPKPGRGGIVPYSLSCKLVRGQSPSPRAAGDEPLSSSAFRSTA